MELDVLFWLAIAAIYILQSIASKRRQPSGPVPEQAGDSAREMPPDLQEALGEIGRVLRGDPFEPAAESRRLPEPHYELEAAPLPEPTRLNAPKKTDRSRKPSPYYDTVKSKPVFYDQAFEEQTSDTFAAPIITHDHEFSFQDPVKQAPSEASTAAPDLKDQMVSRQAFIAAEVLAPPLSKRKGRR